MHSVKSLESPEIWYVTGSQQLSGEEALKKVAEDSRQIAEGFGRSKRIPLKTVFKPVLKAPEEIRQLCMEANSAKKMRRVEGNRTVQQMAGALYYAETFSKEFAVVSLPGAEQRSADIYAALADIRETRRPAAWFLEYFFSLAPEAYQANGFAKLPDAEFGETLPLRPGG